MWNVFGRTIKCNLDQQHRKSSPVMIRAANGSSDSAERSQNQRETIMTDAATTARIMNVAEAAVEEFTRQGVAEVLSNLGFDPMALARAVIKAADGDVVQFPGSPRGH
jgi:hypothetical protein